jgi:hypothetical protein
MDQCPPKELVDLARLVVRRNKAEIAAVLKYIILYLQLTSDTMFLGTRTMITRVRNYQFGSQQVDNPLCSRKPTIPFENPYLLKLAKYIVSSLPPVFQSRPWQPFRLPRIAMRNRVQGCRDPGLLLQAFAC